MRTRVPSSKTEPPSRVRRRRRSSRDDEFIIRRPAQSETNRSRSQEEWTKQQQDRLNLPRTITMAGESVQRLQKQVGNNATQQVVTGATASQRGGGGGDSPEVIKERLAGFLEKRLTDWHTASNVALDAFISDHWAEIQNNTPGFASHLTSAFFSILPVYWAGRASEAVVEIAGEIIEEVADEDQERIESSKNSRQRMELQQFRDIMRKRFEMIVEELKNKRRELVRTIWPEIEREYWIFNEIALSPAALESLFLKKIFDDELVNGSSINTSRVRERTVQELEKEWKKQQDEERSNQLDQEI